MVTRPFCIFALLLCLHSATCGFNYDRIFDLRGVFEKCISNTTTNASSLCVCMNTMPPVPTDKDQRRRITAQSCHSCNTRKTCSVTSCQNLKTCDYKRGCKRLCLCVCPNRTTSYGGRDYIPCDEWCASRVICPAAVCTVQFFSFKISTTGIAIAVTIIGICVLSRIFQKLRRKRIATRATGQPELATGAGASSNENLREPAFSAQHTLTSPAQPTAAPPYSTLPPPGTNTSGVNATSQPGPTSDADAPPDYETVIRHENIYRSPPPKYS